jgi:hypothetical protein
VGDSLEDQVSEAEDLVADHHPHMAHRVSVVIAEVVAVLGAAPEVTMEDRYGVKQTLSILC